MPACHAGGHGFESRTHRQSLPRCVSSAWLECLPVTQEVTGSSPVRTAERDPRVSFLLLVRPVSCLVPLPAKYCKSLSVPTWSPPHSPLDAPLSPPHGGRVACWLIRLMGLIGLIGHIWLMRESFGAPLPWGGVGGGLVI